MAKRIRAAVGGLTTALFIALPAFAQPGAAPGWPELVARLKQVESNPQQLDAMYKAGRKVAAFCANCHGDGGNSVKPDVPNLAGQNSHYLLEQLREFSVTQRKTSEFKKRLVNAMSADEKIGMVVFYAGQEVIARPVADAALVRRGGEIYAKRCVQCHEQDGRGARHFSRIAGQQPLYLSSSLKGYRDGSGARIDREMAAEVKPLTDGDIAALVAYVASMK